MKRLHVHIGVESIDASVSFYSTLFGTGPSVLKDDYAKWMLEDPCVNFAISTRGSALGADHFGIQAETEDELGDLYRRLERAGRPVLEEGETVCCYAQSEKAWITDPQGVPWEAFLTRGGSAVYGGDIDLGDIRIASGPIRAPTPPRSACATKPSTIAERACCVPAAGTGFPGA